MKRLGIIDWGIGGVSIYKSIKESLGDISVTYFSDTGVTPYGKMQRRELPERLNTVIEFLIQQGVTHVIIGCNAASTALSDLRDHKIPIEGVIDPAVALAAKLQPKKLAVIGGRRTVVSGVYRRAFQSHDISIEQRIAQPLSGLIEKGDVSSPQILAAAKQILGPIRNSSHILLACTHYPAITPVLRALVSSQTQFIDPAGEMAKIVSRWKIELNGGDIFLTTGDARAMKLSAKLAFGVTIEKVSSVGI